GVERGDSVDGDDELFELANADATPAGPTMIDAAMQRTRTNALSVLLIPSVLPAVRAMDRCERPRLVIVSRSGVASPSAEPDAVPIEFPPLHETTEMSWPRNCNVAPRACHPLGPAVNGSGVSTWSHS